MGVRLYLAALGRDLPPKIRRTNDFDFTFAVPRQLAVLGFGDFDVAAHTQPALSTVRIPGHDIGTHAATALLARLDGGPAPGRRTDLGFDIVRRESA